MFIMNRLIKDFNCEVCGGQLYFDDTATINDYSIMIKATVSNIFDKVEDVINKHLIYKCGSCGQKYKKTYKEIEYNVRHQITSKVLLLLVREQLLTNPAIIREKFFIYCGKCGGVDGTGCCPKSVFNECAIKRFPINVI